jgi:hypothetical protein
MSIDDQFSEFGHSRTPYKRGPAAGRANGAPGGPPCPTCGSRNSAVVDSRPTDDGGQKRRRRCMASDNCARWNTWETNVDPEFLKAPDITVLDKNRIARLAQTAVALAKSLKIEV